MIKLRLLGSTADLESLIFSSQKKGRRGSHVAPIDDKLFRVLEDVVRKRKTRDRGEPARAPAREPKLAPRDVQRLLRAGRPVEQVARMAGMDAAWVQRFLGPVLDERTVAIQDFQKARLEKPRLGLSGSPIGDAVVRNLRARRVKLTEGELDEAWDASRLDTQPWVISLTFPFRGREQRALWRYDPHSREVSAGNRLGADLGWVGDGRRAPAPRARKPAAARRKPAATGRPVARKPAGRKKAPTRRKPVARKPATKRRSRR